MNRLVEIGFEPAGHWKLIGSAEDLSLELFRHGSQRNILYAFVSDGEVKYVGKTVQPLRTRMNGYRYPGATQGTNIRNNARIKALLRDGAAVDILALPDNGLLHYGQFHVNLAAGLEDNIISVLKPEWNRGTKEGLPDCESTEVDPPVPIDTFTMHFASNLLSHRFFQHPCGSRPVIRRRWATDRDFLWRFF